MKTNSNHEQKYENLRPSHYFEIYFIFNERASINLIYLMKKFLRRWSEWMTS